MKAFIVLAAIVAAKTDAEVVVSSGHPISPHLEHVSFMILPLLVPFCKLADRSQSILYSYEYITIFSRDMRATATVSMSERLLEHLNWKLELQALRSSRTSSTLSRGAITAEVKWFTVHQPLSLKAKPIRPSTTKLPQQCLWQELSVKIPQQTLPFPRVEICHTSHPQLLRRRSLNPSYRPYQKSRPPLCTPPACQPLSVIN